MKEGGLVVLDKPAGMTSHDVVGRVRRIAHTRRVGHAGTLDPMATGVLLIGVERATKLLGYLAGKDKSYTATLRLGQSTVTDDAEGEVVGGADAAAVTDDAVRRGLARLTGEIDQVPSAVSAIKVGGQRSYARVRAGEAVELAARRVVISRLDAVAFHRPRPELLDVDIEIDCSTGTYVRAVARDLGAALGVGGHLTALRRTRIGAFSLDLAVPLEELGADPVAVGLDDLVDRTFERREVDAADARRAGTGQRIPAAGHCGPYAIFGPDGRAIAIAEDGAGKARYLVVLRPYEGT